MKRTRRLSFRDQLPTVPVTIHEIMRDPKFARGAADVRAGRGYPTDYDAWRHTNDRWNYERGRQWARLAPRSVPLKINDKLNPKAVLWYQGDIL